MKIVATATKGGFERGKEYELPDEEAQAMIIAGEASFVAVSPVHNREKAILKKWDTRNKEHLGR